MEGAIQSEVGAQPTGTSLSSAEEGRRDVALISARIERLPVSGWHAKLLAVAATGHVFDAFDAVAIAFVLPVLAMQWKLSPGEIGIMISMGYLGQLVGALLMGAAAERFGRIAAFKYALLIMGLFSLGSAYAWGFVIFVVLRFLQGIGLGGEVPIAATYLNELSPAKNRGRIIFTLESGFSFGVLLTSVIAVWVIPAYGWKSMFFIGALPIILGLLLPRLVPESPRWLAANGRVREAEKILSDIEGHLPAAKREALPPLSVTIPPVHRRPSFKQLLTDGLAARTVGVWIMAFCTSLTGYGLIAWMPTLYRTEYHLPVDVALRYGMFSNVVGFLATFAGIYLIDYIGRRKTFMIGFFGGAIPMLYLAYAGTAVPAFEVMVCASISMLFITFLLAGLYVYAPEIYPTRIRAIGAGTASGWLRIGSIIGPVVVGALLTGGSINSVFVLFGGAAVVGGAAVALFGLETKGRALDEIAS
ncbi:MAG TPA: MFS transporter [Eoetvoesiella sp.]|uniref:MFS transporter n=1 Tax=Eoetvoesiella sp. TaxID=1966355 RepID=UPI002C5D0491|nr:MFS transporter [Eoetvoesiella sp.]HWK60350.1 MFS transporter [Eoetvoesiella sp.]